MNDFEREVNEAFKEVANEGMPILCRLNNDEFKGIVQSTVSNTHLREPGYEGENAIIIEAPRLSFARSPEEYIRQIVEVLEGPQEGDWVLQAVNVTLNSYIMTCKPTE